ncbi:MAG TPA: ABC transporter permease, partial [Microbacterium sp.]|nr:ABC transporter permease [Microbacterium sp.]
MTTTLEPTSGPAAPPRAKPLRAARPRALSAWLWGAVGILLLALVWELYKFLGPSDGVVIGGMRILPRTTDLAMPHVWDMIGRLLQPVTRAEGSPALWAAIALAALTTLGIAAVGWLVGLVVGIALALVMQRWRLVEWGLLPWIIL